MFVIAAFCFLSILPAAAQVTGDFFLEKSTYSPGEPIFLELMTVNTGSTTATIPSAIQEQPLCSGVFIDVSSDPPGAGQGCIWNGGSFPMISLPPGQTHIDRYLLNFGHEISSPGQYYVEAKLQTFRGELVGNAEGRFAFRVDGSVPVWKRSDYRQWIDQLHSPNAQTRMDAALTLASLAPLSLEETLLDFADKPEFHRYAALAFHRLNTPRSLQRMADLTKGPVTGEQMEAAQYLAETKDQQYYPLLLDAAKRNSRISVYPMYAAELGGGQMLPVLLEMEQGSDREFTRLNAVMAMGYTNSRAAIPPLLKLLEDPDPDVSERASGSLQMLTHRTATQFRQGRDLKPELARWLQWWLRVGVTAPVYSSMETGEMVPLL